MEEILVPATVFGSIAAVIISLSYFRTRKAERLALIASDRESDIFNKGEKKKQTGGALKFGIVAVAISIGLIVGDFLTHSSNLNEVVAYLSMILLFGGGGLLTFYFLQKKIDGNK